MKQFPDFICKDGGSINFIPSREGGLIVSSIYVPVEKRSKGIGTYLIRKAQELGVPLLLTVEPSLCKREPKTQLWLEGWYSSLGFRRHPAGFYIWKPEQE